MSGGEGGAPPGADAEGQGQGEQQEAASEGQQPRPGEAGAVLMVLDVLMRAVGLLEERKGAEGTVVSAGVGAPAGGPLRGGIICISITHSIAPP